MADRAMFMGAALLWLAFYPRAVVNNDELFYAGPARMLASGHLTPRDGDPLPVDAAHPSEAARTPLGWSLLLAPLSPLGVRALWVAALLAHLAGGVAFARLLRRRGLPAELVAVYLFHPAFWLYARTLMSDVPATAALLIAVDAWEAERPTIASVALGWSVFARTASLFAAIGFLVAVLAAGERRPRRLLPLGIGLAVGSALMVTSNLLATGRLFSHQYTESGALLDGKMAGENLLLYGAGLLFLPPFSLAWLVRPAQVGAWAWVAAPVVGFFVFYSFHDRSPALLETLVGGQRLILPAHAALMVATASTWGPLVAGRRRYVVVVVALVGAFAVCVAFRHLEARYVPALTALRSCAPGRVAFNLNASRVALAIDAREYHLFDGREASPRGDVAVAALRAPTHTGETRVSFVLPPELRARRCYQVGEFLVFDLADRCPPLPPCGADALDQPP